MTKNMGPVDRVIRGLFALAAVVVGLLIGPVTAWAIVLYVIAGVLALTAAVGTCPLYLLLGFDTRTVRGRTGAATGSRA